ncbi:MAG: MerR family transcriptional regulator, partial [Caulobacterales bacterium]|uniref:MerR family transcriptional regulator n=1 Tax=Glycocaulis sp. TaxID=1969725 RepID=UPI003FA06363
MAKSADAYRTISEAAAEVDLPTHVLRFWETKFTQLKPVKHKGGRRLYRPQDVALLKGLRRLLYAEGYTIKGAQKYLREHGVAEVAGLADGGQVAAPSTEVLQAVPATGNESPDGNAINRLGVVLARVEQAKARLDSALAARG